MKLIIDIPKANYEKMKIMDKKSALENPYLMAIAQGTPLPKEQEPKTGYWIMQDESFKCSECGELSCCKGKYCNECGIKMQ